MNLPNTLLMKGGMDRAHEIGIDKWYNKALPADPFRMLQCIANATSEDQDTKTRREFLEIIEAYRTAKFGGDAAGMVILEFWPTEWATLRQWAQEESRSKSLIPPMWEGEAGWMLIGDMWEFYTMTEPRS